MQEKPILLLEAGKKSEEFSQEKLYVVGAGIVIGTVFLVIAVIFFAGLTTNTSSKKILPAQTVAASEEVPVSKKSDTGKTQAVTALSPTKSVPTLVPTSTPTPTPTPTLVPTPTSTPTPTPTPIPTPTPS
jgi:Na+-transporting methylmalonyl-CoA/oxaloacetate decarboxylase gamma subunit